MVGCLAYSLAGHDKNKVYYIVKEDTNYVWIADGDIRTLDNPKKKNKKHIQLIRKNIQSDISVTNEMVKRAIKLYCKDMQEVK